MRTRTLLLVMLGLVSLCALWGCSTPEEDGRVSTLPWNKPASWEGKGAAGGFLGGSGGGGY